MSNEKSEESGQVLTIKESTVFGSDWGNKIK